MKLQSAANILDSAPSGVDGVGGTELAVGKVGLGERHDSTCLQGKCGHKTNMSSRSESQKNCSGLGAEWGIPPADSQSSPLYLLASEIVDLVEMGRKR